jgi:hypothetical protein
LVLLVIVASLVPNPLNPVEFKGSDKLEHFAAYAFMMLLDLVGHHAKTQELAAYIGRKNPVPTALVPSRPFGGVAQLKPWRILVNAKVEAEA